MICPTCNQLVPGDAFFCIHCGRQVQGGGRAVPSAKDGPLAERRSTDPGSGPSHPSNTAREFGRGRPNQPSGWRRLIAFVLVDAVLIGGVILAMTMGVSMVVRSEKEWSGSYMIFGERRCSPALQSGGDPLCFNDTTVIECGGPSPLFALGRCKSDTVYPSPQDRLSSPLLWLPALGAFFLYLWFGNAIGQTLGKRVLGLRVVDRNDEQPLGIPRGLLRTLGYGLSAAGLGVGFLATLWDGSGRGWHDRLARSVVVRDG
jgi:hypothetical protein